MGRIACIGSCLILGAGFSGAEESGGAKRDSTDKAVASLIHVLGDEEWPVRAHAVESLGEIGEPAVAKLKGLLAGSDEALWVPAAAASTAIGPTARPTLVEATMDERPDIRGVAGRALRLVDADAEPKPARKPARGNARRVKWRTIAAMVWVRSGTTDDGIGALRKEEGRRNLGDSRLPGQGLDRRGRKGPTWSRRRQAGGVSASRSSPRFLVRTGRLRGHPLLPAGPITDHSASPSRAR